MFPNFHDPGACYNSNQKLNSHAILDILHSVARPWRCNCTDEFADEFVLISKFSYSSVTMIETYKQIQLPRETPLKMLLPTQTHTSVVLLKTQLPTQTHTSVMRPRTQ